MDCIINVFNTLLYNSIINEICREFMIFLDEETLIRDGEYR